MPAAIAVVIGLGVSQVATQIVLKNEENRLRLEMERRSENHMRALEYGVGERIRLVEKMQVLFGMYGNKSHLTFRNLIDKNDLGWSNIQAIIRINPPNKKNDIYCEPEPSCQNQFTPFEFGRGNWKNGLQLAKKSGDTTAFVLPITRVHQETRLGVISPIFQDENTESHIVTEYLIGVFSFSDIVENIIGKQTVPSGLDVFFFSNKAPSNDNLIHSHSSRSSKQTRLHGIEYNTTLASDVLHDFKIANMQWSIAFRPIPEALEQLKSNEVNIVLSLGFLVTTLVTLYLAFMTRKTIRIEEIVKARTSELNDANAAKSKFLAAASHDLRQPLQAMNLFINVLSGRNKEPQNEDIFEHLKGAMGSLEGLLNSLLNISKLEANLVIPDKKAFSLHNIFQRLDDEFQPLFMKAGLTLRTMPTSVFLYSDPVLIESILRNLLSNALRNTDNGRVLLGSLRKKEIITFGVWDTGKGIPEDQLSLVFNEFYQVERLDEDVSEGVGLGLAIVARLSKLLNHEIKVKSIEGEGSSFVINVPSTELSEPVLLQTDIGNEDDADFTLEGKTVMVIDDEETVRIALRYQLQKWGAEVLEASCVASALEESSISSPDIILADFRLRKGETGNKAIKAIRKTTKRDIPSILITGDTAPKRLQKAKKSGLMLLHKPISAQVLKKAIKEELNL